MHPGSIAAETPDKPAYTMAGSGEVVTFGQLDDRSNQLAQLLWDRGLRPGDAIAICMENNATYLVATWAAQRSGLYYTAASSRLTPGELEYIINDCGAKAFITSSEKGDLAAEVAGSIPNVTIRLMVAGTARAIDGFESFEEAVGAMPAVPLATELEGGDMLYSSGTTGRPKGVRAPLPLVPMGSGGAVPALLGGLFGCTADSVYLSPAPMYHAAPLRFVMACQRIGAQVVVMEHFDPVDYLRQIEAHRVTHSQVVPTMFVRMLKLPQAERLAHDVSSLECVIHAAAPCPIPVKEQIIAWWGPIVHEYYAGTEGNGFVYCNSVDWMAHKGTVGRAIIGTIHICDDEGNELPTGEPGTIYFEGGAAFEYHNDEKKTEESRHSKGWSTLGDVGRLDEEGFLYLTDRKAYMIISGGVNIYPQEAENILTMHPKVVDVAVFGVPNEDFGEEVKAVVQPVSMEDAGPELERELVAYCKEHLAALKCPRSIDFEEELPRHPTGKLYKRLLRDRYWEGHDSKLL